MGRLSGKVAIVTGAGRGIGRAVARRFAAEGAKVAVLSRTQPNIDRTVAEIEQAGHVAIGRLCDVGNPDHINESVAEVVRSFGTVDILVNNAVEFESTMSPVLTLGQPQVQRQMDTGPLACLRLMQACYPHMKGRDGRIINFASSVGVGGYVGLAPYAMAKEALRALTRVAAREWGADRITVNNVLPAALTDSVAAWLETEDGKKAGIGSRAIPRLGRLDDDIVPIVLFLASADAQYMSGYSLMADGGFMIDSAR